MREEIHDTVRALVRCRYIADETLATTLVLMERLGRPLLIEGEAGVGKTAIAAALAAARGTNLIRIQCYEGIEASSVLYEWNYTRQLLAIRLGEQGGETLREADLYAPGFLLERPLLAAIRQKTPPVLLIDELDRADEAFEAFLLEVLSEFSVTIPELGTITATSVPGVVLTSNGTRELSDALRRRCLFHYATYPDFDRELAILRLHHPDIDRRLLAQVTGFVQRVRALDISKRPGVAETLDWARALAGLDVTDLGAEPAVVAATLSCLVKTPDDQRHLAGEDLEALVAGHA